MRNRVSMLVLWAIVTLLVFPAGYSGSEAARLFCVFMIAVPLLAMQIVEKRKVWEDLGFRKDTLLGTVLFCALAAFLVYSFAVDIVALVLACIAQCIFFELYVLGEFAENDPQAGDNVQSLDSWNQGKQILITAVLFTLTSISGFIANLEGFALFASGISLSGGLAIPVVLVLLWIGVVLGFIYVQYRTAVWCFLAYLLFSAPGILGVVALFGVTMLLVLHASQRNRSSLKNLLILRNKWREPAP